MDPMHSDMYPGQVEMASGQAIIDPANVYIDYGYRRVHLYGP